jgi:hypothetical protein
MVHHVVDDQSIVGLVHLEQLGFPGVRVAHPSDPFAPIADPGVGPLG